MYPKKFKLAPLIAYLCLLPILIALGIWQLNRADEKREIIRLEKEHQQSLPIKLTEDKQLNAESILYNQIEITGYFDSAHQFLLDNQVLGGKAGFFVLTPFHLKNQDKVVLVNRGWITVGRNRYKHPNI